ncbi:hypothetical protein ACTJKB_03195 [Paenibacillus sp. 22594]
MADYVAPEEFIYAKTEIEFIKDWKENHPDATCYYCGKEREYQEMEHVFSPDIVDRLGICKLCFLEFRIGHLWTDRFVVEYILSRYKRRRDVILWFQSNGYEMFEAGASDDPEDNWKAFAFINNPAKYFDFMSRKHKRRQEQPDDANLTRDEAIEMDELLGDRTHIKIFKDGAIEIIQLF